MLTSYATPERSASPNFLEGQVAFSHPRLSNNRSVMPLDVRGCTRATLTGSACAYPTPAGAGNPLNPIRDGDRGLQLFPMNEEFPVSAGHKLALIKSLPFVHTARRYYRSLLLMSLSDRTRWALSGARFGVCREDRRIIWSRGSKSRNKVSVGEPADGSLSYGVKKEKPVGFFDMEIKKTDGSRKNTPGRETRSNKNSLTTLCGGSLGSCVDEERS